MEPLQDLRGAFQIRTATTGAAVAVNAQVAASWVSRLIGLLGRREFPEGEALIFPRCQSIHTVGMRVPIDALFVDRTWRIVALRAALKPNRLVLPVWKAWGVIELPSGTLTRLGLAVDDQLQLTPLDIRYQDI